MEEISVQEAEMEVAVEIASVEWEIIHIQIHTLGNLELLGKFPTGKVKCENFDR